MSEIKKVKVIALDFDGVIARLDIDWDKVRNKASRIAKQPISSLTAFYEEFHGTQVFKAVSSLIEEYELSAIEKAKPIPEAIRILKEASEHGITVYVTTMQSRVSVVKFLHKHGILRYVHEILSREDFPNKKEMYLKILRDEGVSSSEVLVIDDSPRNIRYCIEVGMRCVLLHRHRFEVREIEFSADIRNRLIQRGARE